MVAAGNVTGSSITIGYAAAVKGIMSQTNQCNARSTVRKACQYARFPPENAAATSHLFSFLAARGRREQAAAQLHQLACSLPCLTNHKTGFNTPRRCFTQRLLRRLNCCRWSSLARLVNVRFRSNFVERLCSSKVASIA